MTNTDTDNMIEIELPHKEPVEYSPELLADYMAKAIPVKNPSFRGKTSEGESKRYYQINPCDIIDRNTAFGDQAWMDMVNHHLYPKANPGIFIFERLFNSEFANIDRLKALYVGEDAVYDMNFFSLLMVAYLNARGFFYLDNEKSLKGPDGTLYDGVLIVASW